MGFTCHVCNSMEEDSIPRWRLWDYLQSSRFCRIFQGVLVYFKRHTVEALFPLCLALSAVFPQRPVFTTHMRTHKHTQTLTLATRPNNCPHRDPHDDLSPPQEGQRKLHLFCSLVVPLYLFDLTFLYVPLLPVIRPFLPLTPRREVSLCAVDCLLGRKNNLWMYSSGA